MGHVGNATLVEQRDLIDGVRRVPGASLDAWVSDPNSAERLQPQLATTKDQLERALAAAWGVHESGRWNARSAAERSAVLHRIADGLDACSERLAVLDALTSGVPITVTRLLATGVADAFRSAAAQLMASGTVVALPDAAPRPVRVHWLPWGPAAVLSPWNAPTAVAAKKVAFALAAGCPVVLKPSSHAPSGCNLLADVLSAVLADADAPPATFQLLHGSSAVGQALAGDARVRALSLTGGRGAGRAVARAAASDLKALQLELGSNNPCVVRSDADVEQTADALASAMTKLNGQWCEGPGAVFVPLALHDRLLDAVLDRLASLRMGHCLAEDTQIGPQGNGPQHTQLRRALDELRAHGGKPHATTAAPDLPGWFLPPTVVTDVSPMHAQNEIFGPVITLHRVSDDEEALTLANQCALGLAGYVFSADLDEAARVGVRIGSGEIKINGTSLIDMSERSTQGFWGGSGAGGHGDEQLLRFFRGARIVGVDAPRLPL